MELSSGQIVTGLVPSGDDNRVGYICYDMLIEVASMRGLEQKFAVERVSIVLVEFLLEGVIDTLSKGEPKKRGLPTPWGKVKTERAKEFLDKYQQKATLQLVGILTSGSDKDNWNPLANIGWAMAHLWCLRESAMVTTKDEVKRPPIKVKPKSLPPPRKDIA